MPSNTQTAFERKSWADTSKGHPRSGPGSTLRRTRRLRRALPGLFRDYGVRTFLDVPCGDWNWMQAVDLSGVDYIGGDISGEVIDTVQHTFAGPGRRFQRIDLANDPLPRADMIMVRECLIHLTDPVRWQVLENIARSDISYLLLTIDLVDENLPLDRDGDHQNFNPMLAPFHFPTPVAVIPETADDLDLAVLGAADAGPWKRARAMGLWSAAQIQAVLATRPDR
ncbi:MAG: class I SAM-dependent methyltransferase [Pseudomonadota bacterium]